jgi:hypothetical protein
MIRRTLLAWCLLVAQCSVLRAAVETTAPALNWVVHVFSDKEGYRVLTARGSEVRPGATEATINVTNLSITVYSGDATAHVESVFLSPLAHFFPKDNRANGDQTVRLIRDDLEATSTKWQYDHARKHVTLEGNVRIIFNAEMKDLLK